MISIFTSKRADFNEQATRFENRFKEKLSQSLCSKQSFMVDSFANFDSNFGHFPLFFSFLNLSLCFSPLNLWFPLSHFYLYECHQPRKRKKERNERGKERRIIKKKTMAIRNRRKFCLFSPSVTFALIFSPNTSGEQCFFEQKLISLAECVTNWPHHPLSHLLFFLAIWWAFLDSMVPSG